ncbi:MAG: hypothetical protein WCO94_17900 [Verrucomicrobiota bacterium]
MKYISLTILASLCTLHAESPLLIVNTRFDQVAEGQLAASPPPVSLSELPLTAPTKISVSPPSTALPGTEAIGEMKPPYAMVRVRERENNPAAPANVFIDWDLSKVPLEPGRYQFQFRVAVADFVNDAGNFLVNLLDADGKPVQSHLGNLPRVTFSDGKLRSLNPRSAMPYSAGETYLIEIIVDTQQMTWSSSENGDQLQVEIPLNPVLIEQLGGQCRIGSLTYVSTGGMDNSRPGSALGITDVKATKLN